MILASGTTWWISSIRLAIRPGLEFTIPVTLPTRMVETADNAGLDRINAKRKNNWYRRGSRFGGESSGGSPSGNHSDIAVDEIGCQMRQPIIVTLGPLVFDHNMATIDLTRFCNAAPKSGRLRFTK